MMRVRKEMQFRSFVSILLTLGLVISSSVVHAGAREQAKRIHDRLAGVPPTNTVIDTMAACISGDDATCTAGGGDTSVSTDGFIVAAYLAMENPAFSNVTLKNFATPWTNEEQTVFAPLNDFTATIIGFIRDDRPFNAILSDDLVYTYVGSDSRISAYSMSNNIQYEDMEEFGIDLSSSANLDARTQSGMPGGIPAFATAGVTTTRAAAQSFFIDGTNRAMFRYTFMNQLCTDLEPIKDVTRTPDRIRQDVTRSPGGDSRIFNQECLGCHAGMDGMMGAFAYYEYDKVNGRLIYTDGVVQPKALINPDNFESGFVTTDDSWINYWRTGINGNLGWSGNNLADPQPSTGNGAKSLGLELANTDAFASCQVKKVFRTVCFREPSNAELSSISTAFKSGYRMKQVFAGAASACKGN